MPFFFDIDYDYTSIFSKHYYKYLAVVNSFN